MTTDGRSKPLAWRFALLTSGVAGFIFAGLTIFGWIHGWEGSVAVSILAALGLLIVIRGVHRPVLHGFAIGFFTGFFAVELQALFLPTYFANNPDYALIEIPLGLPARLATAVFAPINALLAGLVTAGMVWLLGRIWKRPAMETV